MQRISTNELRELYQSFFESKGHTRIPSAPLVPEHDPSVLFTTAGMHPLVPYLKGQSHPAGKRLTDVQKSLRTTDIEAVGDASHATVFEMLGNWSLGDYFKTEAVAWSWEFLTGEKWLDIDPNYLAVSVFAGDETTPRDEESASLWQKAGVPRERIAYLDKRENWWPAGGDQPGPQGPDTEMFFWTGLGKPPRTFQADAPGWVEIWNDVFMQFNRRPDGVLEELPQKNVDTGMGLERVVMILNGLSSIYEIDTFQPLLHLIRRHATKPDTRHERIVADHIKAATFILGDEHPVEPSNVERGYVLRRLIRRAVRSARVLGVANIQDLLAEGQKIITGVYGDQYPSLSKYQAESAAALQREVTKFERALSRGLTIFQQLLAGKLKGGILPGEAAFRMYESYGFPIELTEELAREHGITVDMGGFQKALLQHQEASRQGSKHKFAGGLADHSEKSVHYHTATHLLHQALRQVLGEHVFQRGSNITPERLRFDFSHPAKLTKHELEQIEKLVNEKIQEDWPVQREEMSVAEAKAKGALGLFEEKYKTIVSVYSIGKFSVEICGGPHVKRTGGLGKFAITKEESAGSGLRRIKAILT